MPLLPMRWLYRRLGRAYPVVFFVVQVVIGTLVTAGTVVLLTVFYPATSDQKLTLLAITEALTVAGLVFVFARVVPRLRPLVVWIGGRRDHESSLQAWTPRSTSRVGSSAATSGCPASWSASRAWSR